MSHGVRLVACALLLWSVQAHAHKPSDSYLALQTVEDGRVTGRWDIALRDLEHAIGIDRDGDGAISWGEVRQRESSIVQYAFAHLQIAAGPDSGRDACETRFERLLVDEHVDGAYAVLRFHAACPATLERIAVRYSLLFDLDPNHRGLLDLQTAAGHQSGVLSRDAPEFVAAAAGESTWLRALRSFVSEGIWHILHGYDHVLFLLTLLLPAVVLRRNRRWEPQTSLRAALLDVAKVVTAFTLAHSVTLSAAALGWVSLPSRVVESVIALTVVLGALNNLFPVVTERRWLAALIFGLIHGFGFASVLGDLGLQRGDLALALLGFNIGVELGQLAIVLVLVPTIYWMRGSLFYRRIFMPGGAVLIAILAGLWFVERAFEVAPFF